MKKKKVLLFFLLVSFISNCFCQWVDEIYIGEDDNCYCDKIFETEGGSFIASGSKSGIPWLMKFDSELNIVFSKTMDELYSRYGTIVESSPNSFIYGTSLGKRTTTYSNSDVLFAMIDTSGNVLWQKSIHDDSSYNYIFHGISQGDSILYFVGESYTSYGSKGLICKLNFEGDTIWTRKIGLPEKKYTVFKSLVISEDGNIIITGHTGSENYGLPYMLKIDNKGTVLNEMLIDDSERRVSFLNDIIDVGLGEYIIVGGTTFNISYNLYLLRINNELDTIWTRKYSTERFQTGQRIKIFEPNKYTILCSGEDSGQGLTSFFYINENGDSIRSEDFYVLNDSNPYDKERDITGMDFLRREDGSFIMVGAIDENFYAASFDYILFNCPIKTYSGYCSNKIELANMLMYFGTEYLDISWNCNIGVEDNGSLADEIMALIDTTYIISVSDGTKTLIDSFEIRVNPVKINTISEREIHCEDSIQLSFNLVGITNPEIFEFEWSPSDGLSNPYINNPYCSLYEDKYYLVSASYETCFSAETIFINYIKPDYGIEFEVDKQMLIEPPFAFQFENNTPNLIDYNFIWDFGDGDTLHSNNFVVFHEFDYNGLYDVKLIAQSKDYHLCKDSLVKSDFIYTTGGEDPTEIKSNVSDILIYPSPVSIKLNLEIDGVNNYRVRLYSISGNLYYDEKFFDSKSTIDMRNLKGGVYLLKISTDEWTMSKKLIKY